MIDALLFSVLETFQVSNRSLQQRQIVPESTKCVIAGPAEQSAKPSGSMTMINRKVHSGSSPFIFDFFGISANRAKAFLSNVHPLKLFESYPVFAFQKMGFYPFPIFLIVLPHPCFVMRPRTVSANRFAVGFGVSFRVSNAIRSMAMVVFSRPLATILNVFLFVIMDVFSVEFTPFRHVIFPEKPLSQGHIERLM